MSVISRRPPLKSLAEARAWIAALGLPPVPPPAAAAPLPADLVVRSALPAAPTARRAGWAVPAEATLGASPYGPVPLAGLARIAAGEPLPAGTDAVLPPEQASDAGPWAEVTGSIAAGEGVVPPGGHLAAGQVLARAGEVPSVLARLLAAAAEGRLAAMLAALTPSGLSLGPVLRPAIAGLAARPIEETVLGAGEGGGHSLSLPADPAAMLLAWCALLAPEGGSRVEARLARKLPSAVGLSDIVPVRLAEGVARPLAAADCPSLGALATAAGWVEVPPESEGWPEGAAVSVTLFPPTLRA